MATTTAADAINRRPPPLSRKMQFRHKVSLPETIENRKPVSAKCTFTPFPRNLRVAPRLGFNQRTFVQIKQKQKLIAI